MASTRWTSCEQVHAWQWPQAALWWRFQVRTEPLDHRWARSMLLALGAARDECVAILALICWSLWLERCFGDLFIFLTSVTAAVSCRVVSLSSGPSRFPSAHLSDFSVTRLLFPAVFRAEELRYPDDGCEDRLELACARASHPTCFLFPVLASSRVRCSGVVAVVVLTRVRTRVRVNRRAEDARTCLL